MKPFDLEAAKAGKKVQTRDGKPVRIICFDKMGSPSFPILALILLNGFETPEEYTKEGTFCLPEARQHKLDLVMSPEIKEYWITVMLNTITTNMFPLVELSDSLVKAEKIGVKIQNERPTIKYIGSTLVYKEEI